MKLSLQEKYDRICKEIKDLKAFLGLSRVSDADILCSTIVEDKPLNQWAFNMKELVRLIKKKEEYDSFVKETAYATLGKVL
jgi:hypothetical protein